jgi:hypothetical protein
MWRNLFQNFGKKILQKKKEKKRKNVQENVSFRFLHFVPEKEKKRRLLTTRLLRAPKITQRSWTFFLDLWPNLDQSGGCVRGESAQHLGFGREDKKNSAVSRTHARTHARTHVRMYARFPHPMLSLRSRTRTGSQPQILASGRISGRDQDLGVSISSSSSLLLLRGFLKRSLRNKLL